MARQRRGDVPYHHGDLRSVLVKEAVRAIAEDGTSVLSLRELARRAGVSHAAPAHHFGDKAGLLRAVAAEGFRLLAAELRAAEERSGDLRELGAAYVTFAVRRRAYFEVMFSSDLDWTADLDLREARDAVRGLIFRWAARSPLARHGEPELAGVTLWSLVHGLAALTVTGDIRAEVRMRPNELGRVVVGLVLHSA